MTKKKKKDKLYAAERLNLLYMVELILFNFFIGGANILKHQIIVVTGYYNLQLLKLSPRRSLHLYMPKKRNYKRKWGYPRHPTIKFIFDQIKNRK